MDRIRQHAPPSSGLRWLERWPIAYPHRTKPWTVRAGTIWGAVIPETGVVRPAPPAADRDLPGLAPALDQGRLLSYRVGRRAVVRTSGGYIKVVRPRRVAAVVTAFEAGTNPGCGVRVPEVLRSADDGRLLLSTVPGTSLHTRLRAEAGADLAATIRAVAEGLADFHDHSRSTGLGRRQADDVDRWVETVARAEPQFGGLLAGHAAGLPTVPTAPAARLTVVHGDLHDKNVLVDGTSIGLIDLDDLSIGVAEDDLANLGAHLRLRALQAGIHPAIGAARSELLYHSYAERRPVSWARLWAVERRTFFRLACLYRYRHHGRELVAGLLRLALDQRE